MSIPIAEGLGSLSRDNFQYALLDATVLNQDILGNKQITDSTAGEIANDLLVTEYDASVAVLNEDTKNAQNASSGNDFNEQNQIYQNDSAVCQTGQSNASTAVQSSQTQVSQDGTNLSDLISLASTIITIGGYVANLINTAYSS
jgi:hypothetical protein